MTRRAVFAAVAALALSSTSFGAAAGQNGDPQGADAALVADLDALFDDPILTRALMGVKVESLRDGRILYLRDSARHVIPASNMKIVTMAVAAERLGWDFTFETRLEAAGTVSDGTLTGDLIVVGGGDPSIGSLDERASLVFLQWADALRDAGIRRIEGRLIGDDSAFDDESLGAGWAWDNLNAGYSAPSGALSYNENVVVVRVAPGPAASRPATVTLTPPGAVFDVRNSVVTGPPGSTATLTIDRALGSDTLDVSGRIPAGGTTIVRTAAIGNPTRYFVRALEAALAERGIIFTDGAHDIDDVTPSAGARRLVARRTSPPLSVLGGQFMKVSQNFYGEMLLKALGRDAAGLGTAENGRRAVRETLDAWGIADDAIVMYDGSGLSRYDYVTADAIVAILRRMWSDDSTRGRFAALLPVGGRDGTLASRLQTPVLAGRVQAKTGTLNHVRALSGYLRTESGEPLAFSMIANHFTAPSAQIDAVVERALARLAGR